MTRALTAALAISALLVGCGGSSGRHIPASSRLTHVAGSPASKIVLTALGAQRIGIQTTAVRAAPASHPAATSRGQVVIPYASVIYDPSGAGLAFVSAGRLTYAEVRITVDHISGGSVYLAKGPAKGAQVVTVGAEELYGVQTGVLAQT
jgi:hypothetical protein